MDTNNYVSDGTEISFSDFLKYLLSKAKILIILLVATILVVLLFHIVNYQSNYQTKATYTVVPYEEKNIDATVEGRYVKDVMDYLKSDAVISKMSKVSGISQKELNRDETLAFEYPGDDHSFTITVLTNKKTVNEKIMSVLNEAAEQYIKSNNYFKLINLLKKTGTKTRSLSLNKIVVILSVLPFLLVLIYYCVKFVLMNPVLSLNNLKRIIPNINCFEYNQNVSFNDDIVRIDSKIGNNEFVNLEIVDFENSDEIVKEMEEVIKNCINSATIFEIDNEAQDNFEVDNYDLSGGIIKLRYDSLVNFLHSEQYRNLKTKNQIIVFEKVNGNDSIGYKVSTLTENTILILGSNEKKTKIKRLISNNVYDFNRLKAVILYLNFKK